MNKIDYGHDWGYARSRLRGTLVRFNGEPVIVDDIDPGCDVYFSYTNRMKSGTCCLGELNVQPVPLGYVNRDNVITYSYRIPARYWKQGLDNTTLGSTNGSLSIISTDLAKTIMGIFPKPMDAAETVFNEEKPVVAFSRNFGFGFSKIEDKLLLKFRGNTVGAAFYNPEASNLNYKLGDDYEYLQEMLGEVINND